MEGAARGAAEPRGVSARNTNYETESTSALFLNDDEVRAEADGARLCHSDELLPRALACINRV